MNILGIIPSRYASTRFPGKPLANVNGQSMVQCVYNQVMKCKEISHCVVATDDNRIFEHITNFGGNVVMTSTAHKSGTDRCFEAFRKEAAFYDYVINIQGDEPFINPHQISELIKLLDGSTEIATLVKQIKNADLLFSRHVVKCTMSPQGKALYFSRQPIPCLRNVDEKIWHKKYPFYKHVGIYAYRCDILTKITKLEQSSLEKAESLEQLRWLENGFEIKVGVTELESIGIDKPEDIEKIKNI